MAVTKKQLTANKKNAQKSTGPVTSIGKSRVSTNAVKHGVLSKKLVLPDESEEEYEQFLDQLVSSITPKGTLEYCVVEKNRSQPLEAAKIDSSRVSRNTTTQSPILDRKCSRL